MNPVAEHLKKMRGELETAFLSKTSGRQLNNLTTRHYDKIIKLLFEDVGRDLLKTASVGPLALVALGGYGRGEMAPYSDIDLLLLHTGEDEEVLKKLVGKITYPLWDAGIETGGVIRTIDECLRVGAQDIRSLTSMMDARFLAGDRGLFSGLQQALKAHFSRKNNRRNYFKKKIQEHGKRLRKYGDSVFVGEPHVKEGEGGLRCYHTSLWLFRIGFDAQSIDSLVNLGIIDLKSAEEWKEALDFLWRVRFGLHIAAGRKQDRLDFHHQEILARQMGYIKDASRAGLEEFMREFYKRASFVHFASERLIGSSQDLGKREKIKNRLLTRKLHRYVSKAGDCIHLSSAHLAGHPEIAFTGWLECRRLGLRMDNESKQAIRLASFMWDKTIQNSSNIKKLFREIVSDPVGLESVLMEMHETGALFKIVPEFEGLHHKVIYDAYHLYTVDIHTIFLIHELSLLASGKYKDRLPDYHTAYKKVKKTDLLVLACLLHDIGKGAQSSEKHEHSGARIAKSVIQRLGFEKGDQEIVEFLVKSHLILPQLAFYRDIDDLQLIENLAHSVKTTDNLILLYLLTFADLRATNPDVWSSWKGELLTKLYSRTIDRLEGRGYTAEHIKDEMKKKERELSGAIGKSDVSSAIGWLRKMPLRYAVNTDHATIARHYRQVQGLARDSLKIEVWQSADQTYDNLTVVTKDAPGLFSKMCAAFLMSGISILEAQLYTGENGDVIDHFKVADSKGRKIKDNFNWNRIKSELKSMVSNTEEQNEGLIGRSAIHEPRSARLRQSRHGYRTEVYVDNDVSAYYTVVEIHAPDKVGFLHDVAHWFYTHGYDIFMAKATTHVGQAIDIFYIRHVGGDKVEVKKEVEEIKKGLKESLI